MHIALVTPSYLPVPGGGERYVAALARELASRGQRVSVVTSTATRESDFWQGRASAQPPDSDAVQAVSVWRSPVRAMPGGRNGLLAWRKAMVVLSSLPGNQSRILARMARRVPSIPQLDAALEALGFVDVVHAFNVSWESAMVAAYAFARCKRIPFVVTPFAHFGTGESDRVALNSTMDHQLEMMRNAAQLMVLTAAEEEGLTRRGLPSSQITVIGGGIDERPGLMELEPPSVVADQAIPEGYLLFLGRASFDKGAIHAAEAVRQLRQSGQPVQLVLAGSPTDEFDRYFQNLPERERDGILPLGIVSDSDKQQLLAHCAALLLPSRSESLGLAILEAWAYGRPVIGAQAGSIPHVVTDGCDGLLVPFGDVVGLASAVERLITDRELARELGERGKSKVEAQYGWPAVTERVIAGYREILDREGLRAGAA